MPRTRILIVLGFQEAEGKHYEKEEITNVSLCVDMSLFYPPSSIHDRQQLTDVGTTSRR